MELLVFMVCGLKGDGCGLKGDGCGLKGDGCGLKGEFFLLLFLYRFHMITYNVL